MVSEQPTDGERDVTHEDSTVRAAKIGRTGAIVAAVIVALGSLIVAIVAGRDQGAQGAAPTTSVKPGPTSNTTQPTPISSSATTPSSGANAGPAPIPHESGSFDIAEYDYFDLDEEVDYGPGVDVTHDGIALVAENGSQFAPATQGTGDYSKCKSVASDSWISSVTFDEIGTAADWCVTTDEGRLGLLHIDKVPDENDGYVELRFVVWEKSQ